MSTQRILGLDFGERRIGYATADTSVPIAVPRGAILVDGRELETVLKLIKEYQIDQVVVGYPRNQAGEVTAQTAEVEVFIERLKAQFPQVTTQDESLTSVIAEDILDRRQKPYKKEDIDALAAALILEDYLG